MPHSRFATRIRRAACSAIWLWLLWGLPVRAAETIRVVLPPAPSKLAEKAASLFAHQVSQRCGAKVVYSGKADLTVFLEVRPGIGREGYRIAVNRGGGVEIAGNDDRGLLYGVGKYLRTSSYGPEGFTPGNWRGTSVPQKEIRGIYFATHFHNFYHEAPVQEIQDYVDDLSLWGVNSLAVWFDMHHFDGFEDPAAQAMLKRIKAIVLAAHGAGMSTNLMLVANEAYNNSPRELRAVGPGRGAFFNVELCPHKPGAKGLLLKQFAQEFGSLSGVGVDYVTLWPYDSGSCSCELCRPWGDNGFPFIAKPLANLARQYFPHVKVMLSTWFFDRDEWEGLVRAFRAGQEWVNYIMAEPGSHEFNFLTLPVPGHLPLVGFPEISMEGMYPWGGFGANPQPSRFQREWNVVKGRVQGGYPYSEGIFEDLDKVIFSQFYWDPNKDAVDTVREYLSYELSPSVVPEMTKVVRILDEDHHYRWWPGAPGDYHFPESDRWWNPAKGSSFKADPKADEALALAREVKTKLSPYVQDSWRWRILYLRALLDRELSKNQGRPSKEAEEAFRELVDIYHASNADVSVKPPLH